MKLTKTKLKEMIREEIQKLNEAPKLNAAKIVKMLKNKSDWGDQGDQVRVRRGNLEVIDTWYYGGDKALKSLKDEWTKPSGYMAKYFKDEHNVMFKLIDEFTDLRATGKWYKKLTDDGIVSITLKVIQH